MKKRVYYVDFERPMRQTLSRTVARKEFGGYGTDDIYYPNGYESPAKREHIVVVSSKWEDGNFHMFCI